MTHNLKINNENGTDGVFIFTDLHLHTQIYPLFFKLTFSINTLRLRVRRERGEEVRDIKVPWEVTAMGLPPPTLIPQVLSSILLASQLV